MILYRPLIGQLTFGGGCSATFPSSSLSLLHPLHHFAQTSGVACTAHLKYSLDPSVSWEAIWTPPDRSAARPSSRCCATWSMVLLTSQATVVSSLHTLCMAPFATFTIDYSRDALPVELFALHFNTSTFVGYSGWFPAPHIYPPPPAHRMRRGSLCLMEAGSAVSPALGHSHVGCLCQDLRPRGKFALTSILPLPSGFMQSWWSRSCLAAEHLRKLLLYTIVFSVSVPQWGEYYVFLNSVLQCYNYLT